MGEYLGPDLLRAFLDAKRPMTQAQAAGQLGIVPAALTAYLKRKQRPRSDIRQRIAKWSEGAVPEGAWLTAEERVGMDGVHAAVIPTGPTDEDPDSQARGNHAKPTGTDS
jgi:transcriptional regulator with XRE-family HTH domain